MGVEGVLAGQDPDLLAGLVVVEADGAGVLVEVGIRLLGGGEEA